MIPDHVVQQIQDRLDIVEVVGGYVPLKRAGRHYKALCPFHPEKTPSFMVNPTKQIFHCFGCGEGGDAISFVMKFERLEFPEAIRVLAPRAGVEVPAARGPAAPKPSETAALFQALEFAAAFFQRTLASAGGAPAQAYLVSRGVSPASQQELRLGFAPERWDALLAAVEAAGLSPAVVERAGLAVAREGGSGFYDRFRGRVMFPVWDPKGKVIGFGGRVLDQSQPKYMNSPETEVYTKSRVLYGLHLAAPHIREQDEVAIVEGYLDFLIPYQLGVRHVVASMGTSLTPDQIHLLRRYTKRVIIVYDGDYAGELATLRGLDLLLVEGMQVRIAALPAGEDPDGVARRVGAEGFRRLLTQAEDLFVYKLGVLRRRYDAATVDGRVAICEQLLPTIKRVPSAPRASEYLHALAEALKMSEEALRVEVGRVRLEGAPWRPSAAMGAPPTAAPPSAERLLLGLVLEDPRYAARVQADLPLEAFQDASVREALEALMSRGETGEASLQEVARRLKRHAASAVVAQALMLSDGIEDVARAVEDCVRAIRREAVRRRLRDLQARIQTAETTGDEQQVTSLIGEYNQLMKGQAEPWRS